MIEQGTIQQRRLEEQISYLQCTLASLQARQAASGDEIEPMSNDIGSQGVEAISTDIPLAIAAG